MSSRTEGCGCRESYCCCSKKQRGPSFQRQRGRMAAPWNGSCPLLSSCAGVVGDDDEDDEDFGEEFGWISDVISFVTRDTSTSTGTRFPKRSHDKDFDPILVGTMCTQSSPTDPSFPPTPVCNSASSALDSHATHTEPWFAMVGMFRERNNE